MVSGAARRTLTMMNRAIRVCMAVVVFGISTLAHAGQTQPPATPQTENADTCQRMKTLAALTRCRADAIRSQPAGIGFNVAGASSLKGLKASDRRMLLLAMALKKATSTLYEDTRVDEQTGSNSASSGTTSLVSKAGVPSLLSMALENGAITQSASGTTVTLSGNVAGIIKAVDKHGYLSVVAGNADRWYERLSNLTASASFDTSRGIAQGSQPTFTGSDQQLSAWSFKDEFFNSKVKNLARFWDDAARKKGWQLNADPKGLPEKLPAAIEKRLTQWFVEASKALTDKLAAGGRKNLGTDCRFDDLCAALADKLRDLPTPEDDDDPPDLNDALKPLTTKLSAWLKDKPEHLARAVTGTVVSGEFVTNRVIPAPLDATTSTTASAAVPISLSTARLIMAATGPNVSFTLNAAFSFFPGDLPPTLAKHPHNVELAAQLDAPFGTATGIGRLVFSASGKYQHMFQEPIDLVTGVVGKEVQGDILLGQLKLTIPTKGTGVKVPISITFANRSDLIKEKKQIRGHIGISYDLDSLLAKFRE